MMSDIVQRGVDLKSLTAMFVLCAFGAGADGICSDGHSSGAGAAYDPTVARAALSEAQMVELVQRSLVCAELEGAVRLSCYAALSQK